MSSIRIIYFFIYLLLDPVLRISTIRKVENQISFVEVCLLGVSNDLMILNRFVDE